MKAKRPFGAHVCFTPKTGVRADIPGPPVWATFGLMRRSIIRFNSSARASFGQLRFPKALAKVCLPREPPKYCKGGIDLRHTSQRLARLGIPSKVSQSGRQTTES